MRTITVADFIYVEIVGIAGGCIFNTGYTFHKLCQRGRKTAFHHQFQNVLVIVPSMRLIDYQQPDTLYSYIATVEELCVYIIPFFLYNSLMITHNYKTW